MNRTKNQKIIDLLLDLKAIETASKAAKFDGLLMLQKIVFVAAEKYRLSGHRVFNQSFYRWDWGPMSDDVYEDFGEMKNLGLVTGDKDSEITLTPRGRQVLESVSGVFRANEGLLSGLMGVAEDVRGLDSLLEEVYSLKVYVEELDKEMEISQIPEGVDMLTPVWESDAKEVFKLDHEWLETLDLLLDSEADSRIRESLEDARAGKFLPLELD